MESRLSHWRRAQGLDGAAAVLPDTIPDPHPGAAGRCARFFRQSRRGVTAFLRRLVCAASLLLLAAGNLASAQRSSHFELQIARQDGAATEIAGTSEIDVAFTFEFPVATRSEDIALLQINANGFDIGPAINASGSWSFPRPNQIKLVLPLSRVLASGVALDGGRTTIAFAARLQLRGSAGEIAAGDFDLMADGTLVAVSSAEMESSAQAATVASLTPDENAIEPAPQISRTVLAQATITAAGGTIEVGNALKLSFPAGALAAAETITVRRIDGLLQPDQGALYDISRSSGEHLLQKPVGIEYQLPAGTASSKVMLVREVAPDVLTLSPAAAGPVAGRVTTSSDHFSLEGYLVNATGETITGLNYALSDSIRAGAVIIVYGVGAMALPAVTAGPSLGTAIVTIAGGAGVGWFSGVPREMSAKLEGFTGPLKVVGFELYWQQMRFHGTPGIRANFDAEDRFIGFSPLSARDARDPLNKPQTAADPASRPGPVAHWTFIPLSVLRTASLLQGVRAWFRDLGFDVPAGTIVRIHDQLGKDSTGARYLGEWDQLTLNVDAGSVLAVLQGKPATGKFDELLATFVHEYWHALFEHGKSLDEPFIEAFPGAEEAMAVAFESIGAPNWKDFVARLTWKDSALRLASGLVIPGDNEDYTRRGYDFWPFAKFLFHRKGGARTLLRLARGKLVDTELDLAFTDFVYSLSTLKDALAEYEPVVPVGDYRRSARVLSFTGWSELHLKDLLNANRISYVAGRVPLPESRPLSLRLVFVKIPAAVSQSQAPLVVRRRLRRHGLDESLFAWPPTASFSEWKPVANRANLLDGLSGILLPASAFGAAGARELLPLAVVGLSGIEDPNLDDQDALLVYPLLPPALRSAGMVIDPETEEPHFRIEWDNPSLGQGIKVNEALAGYRVFGRKVGVDKALVVADLLFTDAHWESEVPKGWHLPGSVKAFALDEGAASAVLPANLGVGYVQFGLASMEGILTAAGDAALSSTAWLAAQQGRVLGKIISARMTDLRNRPEAEDLTISRQQVRCTFTHAGTLEEKWLTSDRNGEFAFDVPLNVPVMCQHANKKATVICSETAPTQSLTLGGSPTPGVSTNDEGIEREIPRPPD